MTEYEYDSMAKFLERLVHTRTAAKDLTAERRIQQALARQPFAAYFLVQRSMSLELALERARQKIRELEGEPAASQPAPQLSGFLDGAELVWGRNAETAVIGPSALPDAAAPEAGPSHITLEDRCVRFIGKHTVALWAGIALVGVTVAVLMR